MSRNSLTDAYHLSEHPVSAEPKRIVPARKLRESCNACHLAKVKCIKTSADCARCSSFGIQCAYSPSARTGKPRGAKDKNNRQAADDTNGHGNVSANTNSNPNHSSATLDNRLPLTSTETPAVQPLSQSQQTEDLLNQTNPSQHPFTPNYETHDPLLLEEWGNGVSNALLQYLSHDRPFFPPSHPASTNASPALDNYTQPNWVQAALAAAHPPYYPPDRLYHRVPPTPPQFPMASSVKSHDENNIFDQLAAIPLSPGSSSLSHHLSNSLSSCNCFSSNLKSLQTLRRHSDPPSPENATPFDIALYISKEAINHCTNMLKCTYCMRATSNDLSSSTPVLILAGLMDDILTSYSAACAAHFDDLPLSSNCNDCSRSSPSSSTEMTTTNPSTSMAYSSSQLTLGTYLVDGEEGRHLKLEILRIELRKVERLWVQFKEVVTQLRGEDRKGRKSLCDALVAYLGQTLRRTVDMLEARRALCGIQ